MMEIARVTAPSCARHAGGVYIIIALYTRDLDVSVSADVIFSPPEFHGKTVGRVLRASGSSFGEIACVRKVPARLQNVSRNKND